MEPTWHYCDAHCHLLDYKQHVLDEVLENAAKAGVRLIVCNSIRPEEYQRMHKLSTYAGPIKILKSFGVHPFSMDVLDDPNWLSLIEGQLIKSNEYAVGETGLDFRKDMLEKNNKDRQFQAFEKQMQLALKYNRPISVHNVRAHGQMLKYFKKMSKRVVLPSSINIIMHSYGGSAQITKSLLKCQPLSFYFSLALKRTEELCSVIPLDRLLLETDGPYQLDKEVVMSSGLFPDEKFIHQNEPRFLKAHHKLAGFYDLTVDEFFHRVWKNSLRAFRLVI